MKLYICQLFLKVQWARRYEPQTGSQKAEWSEATSDSSSFSQPSVCCCSTHLFCFRSSRWMWLNSGRSVGSSAQQRCISWPSSGLWLWGSTVGLRQGHSPRTTRSTISAEGEEHQENIRRHERSSQVTVQNMLVLLFTIKHHADTESVLS